MAQNTVRLPHLATTPPPPARSPGRPKGRLNNATLEIRGFFREFFESPRYRDNLRKRILAGEANHMEVLGHYYAYGRPKQPYQVEVRQPSITLTEVMQYMTKEDRHAWADLARRARAIEQQLLSGQLPPAASPAQAPIRPRSASRPDPQPQP